MTRLFRATAVAVAALAAAACTLLGSRDVIQCRTDGDCPSIRPVCSESLCVAGNVTTTDAAPDVDAASPACARTEDCDQSQLAQLCVAGTCRRATDTACPVLLPADSSYRQDGAIVVGVYVSDPFDVVAKRAVELALSEIDTVLQRPKLVALVCGKGASLDKNTAEAALTHLAGLQVPLVYGQFESSELGKIVLRAVDQEIAVWSTLANVASLPATSDSKGLYRFLLADLAGTAGAYQKTLDEALVRAAAFADAGGPIASPRVALVVNETAEARALADALTTPGMGLTVEGQAIATHPGFTKLVVQSMFDVPSANYQPTFSQLASSLRPHVVLAIGGDEMVQKIVTGTETNWGAAERPVWIVSSRSKYNANDLVNLTSRPAFRARFLGVDFSGDKANHDAFVSAAQAKSSPLPVQAFDHLYDATYAVAYAAVAADRDRAQPTDRVAAKDLLRGLEVLAPPDDGAAVVVNGARAFATGITAVRQGTKIRLVGTTGPWTFDAAHVTRRMGASLFCFRPGTSQLSYYVDPSAAGDAGACAQP